VNLSVEFYYLFVVILDACDAGVVVVIHDPSDTIISFYCYTCLAVNRCIDGRGLWLLNCQI